jgi:hypothetical protein
MTSPQYGKPAECFAFLWRRREKGPGFRWEKDQRGQWLLVGPPQESLRPYEPLVEETGLFLMFANLDGSKADFLQFANTYGRLGTYHVFLPECGEPLDEWQRHHRWMHFLAGLRSKCLKERPQLGDVVRWQGEEIVYHFPKIGTGADETWRHRGQLRQRPRDQRELPLFRPGDLRGPALWFLGYALEDWLRELEGRGKPIAPRMVWSEQDSRPQLVFGPSSLLGAMVCQFAVALHGAWPFQECAYCHKFFRLEPGVNRANRLTCSSTCKQYLHNRRVERACELHAQGWTVRQIVRELNVRSQGQKTNVAIVTKWVGKPAVSRLAVPERGDANVVPEG